MVDHRLVQSILIIKLRGVGDVLLSTVVTKNLRVAFPAARIDFLTEPASLEVLQGNPFVNQVVVFDRTKMSGADLIRKVRQRSYSMIIDLFGNPRTALVTRLSGAAYRVGYRFRWRSYAYNILVSPRGSSVHNTQFNLDALAGIGVAVQDRNVYFQFTRDDAAFVDRFLQHEGIGQGLVAAINTAGGWYTKRWGLDRYAGLGDALIKRYNASVVLPWGPGQLDEAKELQSLMKYRPFIPPQTTLKQLGALMKRCSFVVGNDSGPMHIAAAVDTPVLGIYGPTNPALQGPYGNAHLVVRNEGLSCLGCNLTKCPIGHPCMLELSVETVLESVDRLLKKNNLIS